MRVEWFGAGRIENVALRRPRSDQAHPCICDFAAAMSTGTSISQWNLSAVPASRIKRPVLSDQHSQLCPLRAPGQTPGSLTASTRLSPYAYGAAAPAKREDESQSTSMITGRIGIIWRDKSGAWHRLGQCPSPSRWPDTFPSPRGWWAAWF
jgi:hypothetical protein